MKTFTVLFLGVAFGFSSFAQSKGRQQMVIAGQNMIAGGLIAGVGASLNKQKKISFFRAFTRGFAYGCLGGMATFAGKKLVYRISAKDQLTYGWASKLVHSAGVSVIENVGSGKAPFKSWHTNVGFVRLEYHIDKTSGNTFRAKLMPVSFGDFIYCMMTTKNLDPGRTIKLGTPVFIGSESFFRGIEHGSAGPNTIAVHDPIPEDCAVMAHEQVHILQYNEALTLNTWVARPAAKLKNSIKSKFLRKVLSDYIYFDVPYHPFLSLGLQQPVQDYYKNPYEMEAQHFATNNYVRR